MTTDFDQFYTDIQDQISAESSGDESGLIKPELFTTFALNFLESEGETDGFSIDFLKRRGVEISAFAFPDNQQRIDLFGTIFNGTPKPSSVPKGRVQTAFDRLLGFYKGVVAGQSDSAYESKSLLGAAKQIRKPSAKFRKLHLHVLTDGITKIDHLDEDSIDGLEISKFIWDINRIHRQSTSGTALSPVELDLRKRNQEPLNCLQTNSGDWADYRAYMTIIPGEVLASLYDEYGPRLLERNVRTYLSARSKVNKGILASIDSEPEHFLAYNNGITVTAESLEFNAGDGPLGINKISNMQIVNGGQTTASIHRAKFVDGKDVSAIMVPAKIIQVDTELLDDLVPRVTRYANSQNKVSESDLAANDQYFVEIEKLSRSVLAPAVGGSQEQSSWFFERARGQYQELKAGAGTPSERTKWGRANPTGQKFTKTDLAKFINTWDQLPHEVSKYASKNFVTFMERLNKRSGLKPDNKHFRWLVAKIILFKSAEKIVTAQQVSGPRSNIVAYALAYISHKTAQRVDLDEIWKNQQISDSMADLIEETTGQVRTIIENSEKYYKGEWYNWVKLPRCWDTMLEEISTDPIAALDGELLGAGMTSPNPGIEYEIDGDDAKNIVQVGEWSSEQWFDLAKWARSTDNLEGWQRSIAFNIGKASLQPGSTVSRKLAAQGVKIMEDAKRLGFNNN
jgi:hypothetical protein